MSEDGPSKRVRTAASRRHLIAWLATGGVVAAGLIYIIVTMVIKPNGHFAKGPAGEAVSTGPATVSEAAPGSMHVIPAMSARGVGQLVPEIAFTGPDGKPVTIASLKGKVVLLNFWATWCSPCRAEMPHLAELQKSYAGKDFMVLALSIDSPKATEKAQAFIAQNAPLSFYQDKEYLLPPAITPPIVGFPTSLFIDKTGRIRGVVNSDAEWTGAKARAAIDQLLAE